MTRAEAQGRREEGSGVRGLGGYRCCLSDFLGLTKNYWVGERLSAFLRENSLFCGFWCDT